MTIDDPYIATINHHKRSMNNFKKKTHFKTTIENNFDFYRCSPIVPRQCSQFLQQPCNTNKNITHNLIYIFQQQQQCIEKHNLITSISFFLLFKLHPKNKRPQIHNTNKITHHETNFDVKHTSPSIM
jgi:hypothetical protein